MKYAFGYLSALMILLTGSLILRAQEINVKSTVNEVTLYHTGALVNREASLNLSAGPHELVFKNVSSKLILSTLKIGDKGVTMLNKTLVKKRGAEEVNVLNDRKSGLENQLALLEKKYNEAGFVKDVVELEKMLSFYYDRIVGVKKELRQVERELEEAAELEKVTLENENAAILKIMVSVEKAVNRKIAIQYLVGSVAWSPGYEVSVNTSTENNIHFKYQAKVINYCGEDWENVKVHLSSAFPLSSPTKLPKPEQPWVLASYRRNTEENQQMMADPTSVISDIEGVTYEDLVIPTYIQTRTLVEKYSIKANKTIFSFPIAEFDLPAAYYYHAYPSMDPEAYLVANITEWDKLGLVDGYAYISVDGDDVGTTYIKYTDFIDTLTLPIGKDNTVFVNRKEKADEVFLKASGSRKFKEKYSFQYDLKNNGKNKVLVKLYDQIPISQNKSFDVDVEDLGGGRLDEEKGEVLWTIFLKPGESAEKQLKFEVETDTKGGVIKQSPAKMRSYRTVKWL